MPLIGLFSLDHMAFDIDRSLFNEPSLAEMTEKALDLLTDATENSDKGFILLVEGSRIGKIKPFCVHVYFLLILYLDMAAHKNDAAAHYRDVVAFQRAVQVVKRYTEDHISNTLMISTSDHETGGLAVGRQLDPKVYPDYCWFPEPIVNVTRSVEYLSNATYWAPRESEIQYEAFIRNEILDKGLFMKDPSINIVHDLMAFGKNRTIVEKMLAALVSRASQVGWSTHGHSGVDVNLYAFGHRAKELAGNHDNTFVGSFMEDYLGFNLDEITERVKNDPVTDAPWTNTYLDHKPPFRIRHYHMQGSIFD